jgi:hypothetical protein
MLKEINICNLTYILHNVSMYWNIAKYPTNMYTFMFMYQLKINF